MKTRSEIRLFRIGVVCALCLLVLGMTAQAKLYIFGQITGEDLDMCPNAFTMEVSDVVGENQALFTFTNNCDNGGVLGRIFIMENDLIEFKEIFAQPEGVSFSEPLKDNAMLPGGSELGFTPHNTYGIYADPARPKNGLHYEDYVSILFNLNMKDDETYYSFDDVIAEIDDQSLGLGFHVQSLPGDTSASFTPIPEPLTLSLLGIGTLLIRNKRRGTAQ